MSEEEYDFTNILEKPNVVVTFVFLVVFYIIYTYLTSSSRSSSTDDNYYNVFEDNDVYPVADNISVVSNTFFNIIIVLFIIFIIYKGYQILFNREITASIKDASTNNPKIDIYLNNDEPETKKYDLQPIHNNDDEKNEYEKCQDKKYEVDQVFNIPENIYTYDDASALCNAYGGRLATYNEIEKSYNKGGEWCSYGWSEGQHVFFPTQEKTYNTLQSIKGHEHDCGRPGINGGYIPNSQARFGANCYGKKPIISEAERDIMDTAPLYPLNEKDIWFNQQVEYFRRQLDNILISPFNKNRWSVSYV
jgi:hypothetical protein